MLDPTKTYEALQDAAVSGDLDTATELARQLYNHLVEGGAKPQRPLLPPSFCNHYRTNTAVPSTGYPGSLSGFAWVCRGINNHMSEAS